jgi:hypothetical protein
VIRRVWIVAGLLLLGCKEVPTSVLVEIAAAPGVSLDELRLTIYEPGGQAVRDRRLPEQGTAKVPSSVVLYPRGEGVLRLLVRARLVGAQTGEDATSVTVVRAAQARAFLLLRPGSLPDGDGDGVPDLIDSCPSLANPAQGPCAPVGDAPVGDAGRDGPGPDAPVDQGAAERRDGPGADRALDAPRPDLRRDGSKLDGKPKPDLPRPDLPRLDLPKPDLAKPDLSGCALSGSFSIPSATFPTIASAIAKLQSCGVKGATTFTVAGGTYQEPGFSFPPVPGSSTSARVTFRAATGSVVKLAGVTSTTSSYSGIIRIAANTAHLVLEGFDLDGSLAQNVIPSSYSGPVLLDMGGGQSDITLRGLDIHDFGPGAWSSYTYIGGIYIQQSATVSDLSIEGCSFRNLNPSMSFHTQGAISTRNGTLQNLRIVGNRFVGIQKMDCVNLRNGTLEGLLVANNFFSLDAGAAGAGALEFYGSDTLVGTNNRIVFNTVYAPSGIPYAFSGSVTGSLQLQNNILQGTSNTTVFSSISGATLQGGYNCLYLAAAGSGYTLATTDVTQNPQLVGTLDLHLTATTPLLGKGVAIPGITTDIDGDARSTPPEIGADER